MALEGGIVREAFIADVTSKRLLPGMDSFVCVETTASSKPLAAQVATERLLSGVRQKVIFQSGWF